MSSPSGLSLPPGFPDEQFEELKNRIMAKVPRPTVQNPSPAWHNLSGGHSAVRYRMRACVDYSNEFIENVRRTGESPPPEDRYKQERQLFGFFVSGIAALDSFSFFLYFAAGQLELHEISYPKARPYLGDQSQEHRRGVYKGVSQRSHNNNAE